MSLSPGDVDTGQYGQLSSLGMKHVGGSFSVARNSSGMFCQCDCLLDLAKYTYRILYTFPSMSMYDLHSVSVSSISVAISSMSSGWVSQLLRESEDS